MELRGLRIKASANTLFRALEMVPGLAVDVAILDGNMGTNLGCGDGEKVAALIEKCHPQTVTVGLSFGEFRGKTVDIAVNKFDILGNRNKLAALIEEIKRRVES